MKNYRLAAIALACVGLAASAQAAWVINEISTETTGSPNLQYVELYNSVPNSSVEGLTVIGIRSSTGVATCSADLHGSATGNYYLISNFEYGNASSGIGAPTADVVMPVGQDFRPGFHQTILINTADKPAGFTSGTSGFSFSPVPGTSHLSEAQIIDSVQLTSGPLDPSPDPIYWPGVNDGVARIDPDSAFGFDTPYGANRFPDGAENWEGDYTLAPNGQLSAEATPKAANTFSGPPSDVTDWMMY